MTALVLALPDYQQLLELYADPRSSVLGAMLAQNVSNIAYASRTLSAAERNYPITERECFAVIRAL